MKYTVSVEEQETTIRMGRGEKTAQIYTSDRRMMAKMDRLVEHYPEDYKCVWVDEVIMGDGLPVGKKYAVTVKLVKMGKPTSEARREAGRRAIAAMRATNEPLGTAAGDAE